MSAPVYTVEPTRFAAGDTLLFTRSLADYPATDWILSYKLVNSGHAYGFDAIADGSVHSVTVARTVTAVWTPGDYQLNGTVHAIADGEQHWVYTGLLTVLVNKASTQPIEFRSWQEVALANIETALVIDAGRGSVMEYSINGRSVRASYTEAIKMRDYLKAEVLLLTNVGGRQRKILTRFRSPRNGSSAPFV